MGAFLRKHADTLKKSKTKVFGKRFQKYMKSESLEWPTEWDQPKCKTTKLR